MEEEEGSQEEEELLVLSACKVTFGKRNLPFIACQVAALSKIQ